MSLRGDVRGVDPGRLARDRARAGLEVEACPFCGGGAKDTPGVDQPRRRSDGPRLRCCCSPCFSGQVGRGAVEPARGGRFNVCVECPHNVAAPPELTDAEARALFSPASPDASAGGA